MKFWRGPLIRRLILNVTALALFSILISLVALFIVQSVNQSMRQAQAITYSAALSARIRSQCMELTAVVRLYVEQTSPSADARNEIGLKQVLLAQLMDQALTTTDLNQGEESLQIAGIRQNILAFSGQVSRVLESFDRETSLGPDTTRELMLLTEDYQSPLLRELEEFENSEFLQANIARGAVDRYIGLVMWGMVLAIVVVGGVVGMMVRQVILRVAAPLENLRRGVDLLREGNLERTIPVTSQDEVGQLAGALNTLAAEVRTARAQDENYARLLESQVDARTQEAEQRANQAALLSQLAQSRTEELERLASQAQTAQEIASAASGTLDLEMLLQQSVDLIQNRFHLDHVGLFLLDDDLKIASLRAATGALRELIDTEATQLPVDESSLVGWVIMHRQYRLAQDLTQAIHRRRHTLLPDTGSELALPLINHGLVIGALSVQSRRLDAFEPAAISIFLTMAAQLSNAIVNAKLYHEVEQMAILDSLTGIYNRRHWFELATREFYRAVRYQKALTLIMLDIDHFKQVNDIYGHPVGDRVLRSLSEVCANNLRAADLIGRYGGEEFLVALPETDEAEAVQIAERLRTSTEELTMSTEQGEVRFTISLGVTALEDANDMDLNEMVKRVDEALYLAKRSGRNQVSVVTSSSKG